MNQTDKHETKEEAKHLFLPLLLSGMLALGLLLGGRMMDAGPVVEVVRYHDTLQTVAVEGAIEELIRFIDARYVDEIHRDSLMKTAVKSLMGQLDPHSEFLPAQDVIRLKESREGRFSGIGVEYVIIEDTVHVMRAIPDSPAKEAGIRPGDRLLTVDDQKISGAQLNPLAIAELMRGDQGSRLRMKLWRPGAGNVDISMRRANVDVPSVLPGIMLDSITGYLAIRRFGTHTYREFMQELEKLINEKGMLQLILDLRGNPGGYLQETVNILSQLFEERKKVMVYTVGRNKDRRDYETTGRNFFELGRLLVLVDEGSASASEILAGAVQDWDRGLIVGRRTFGKGLVQEQYALSNGAAILLTIARYYTPSGRSIQRDYSDHHRYKEEITERIRSGDKIDSTILPADTTTYFTFSGRKVYGGGGITPDIQLPIDTIRSSEAYIALASMVSRFILFELLPNGDATIDAIQTDDEAVWNAFVVFAEKQDPKWKRTLKQPEMVRALSSHLLLEIARVAGGLEAQNEIRVHNDHEIKKALQLIYDHQAYKKLMASSAR